MDLSKLTPAPWTESHGSSPIADTGDYFPWCNLSGPDRTIAIFEERRYADSGDETDDAEFCALARNAFDVMMRRGWTPLRTDSGEWWIIEEFDFLGAPAWRWPDPFTALVEADKWYSEHVEKGPSHEPR